MNNKPSICYHGNNCAKFKIGLCKFHSINDYNCLIKELTKPKILSRKINITDNDFPRLGIDKEKIDDLIKSLDLNISDFCKYKNEIIEYLNKDEFLKMSCEYKRNIYGQIILNLISRYLEKDELHHKYKIVGMMIDFELFEDQDIINIINDEKKIIEYVQECLNLLLTQK